MQREVMTVPRKRQLFLTRTSGVTRSQQCCAAPLWVCAIIVIVLWIAWWGPKKSLVDTRPAGANADAATLSTGRSSINVGLSEHTKDEDLLAHAMQLEAMLQIYGAGITDHFQGIEVEELKHMKKPALELHTRHLEDLVVKHVGFLRMQPKAEVLSAAVVGPLEKPQQKQARSDCGRKSTPPASCNVWAGLPEWCGAFKACDTKNIAVVGNGPLSAQQRSELKSGRFQVIVRFNYLNNRLPGEQMDVWVMRWGDKAKLHFWGLSQMTEEEGGEALQAAKSVWLLAELDQAESSWKVTQPLYRKYPRLKKMDHALLSISDTKHFPEVDRWPGTETAEPSTGWLGTMYALQCRDGSQAPVHMYGFNWHDHLGDTHPQISEEYAYFQQAEEDGRLVVHPTDCVALRSCGNDPRNDVRQDCRIFGTNVLGKDIYRCAANLDIGTDLGKTGQFAGQVTRQKARHEKESQLQAMMTQLFPDVENEA